MVIICGAGGREIQIGAAENDKQWNKRQCFLKGAELVT
jgi:hypothetical protein